MMHSHYLSNKRWCTAKTGQHYNYFNANSTTQTNLFKLGFKYYTDMQLDFFGSHLLLKVIKTYTINDILYCECINTINFKYVIDARQLYLNMD